jgi:xylulokinase
MPPPPLGNEGDLVLGVDSSTQATKAVLVRALDGTAVDERRAGHPDATEVDPRHWVDALAATTHELLLRAGAVAVAGQQHGMVALAADGEPVRPALLWNDLRSAGQAATLVDELGGPGACARAVGSVLVASFTVTKLRWLRDHEPEHARAVRQVLLPHDFLTWQLSGRDDAPVTDRGDASGTGYFSARDDVWRHDIASHALGHDVLLPRVAPPAEVVGRSAGPAGVPLSCGTGDNMAAALGLGLDEGDVAVSIGTSGVASVVSGTATADPAGLVSGFADATGRFLPLVCTLNASRVLDLTARLLGVDHAGLARLALDAQPSAGGLTLLPYLDGERTPNLPQACGTLHGLTSTTSREQLARSAVEGLLCSLADAVDHLAAATGTPVRRVVLVGGGARNQAVRALAPAVLGVPVLVPAPAEYVARGAARQAAWALSGTPEPPPWPLPDVREYTASPTPEVRARYATLRDNAPPPPRPARPDH